MTTLIVDLAEGPGDRKVGHHLTPRARVSIGAGGVGCPTQCRVRADTGGDGEQGGQVGHRVRCRPQPHAPLGLGPAVAGDHRGGVELVRGPVQLAHQCPFTQRVRTLVVAESLVDGGAVFA